MSPSDRVAQLYPQVPSSLFVAFYDSQGYGEGILTGLHMRLLQNTFQNHIDFANIFLAGKQQYVTQKAIVPEAHTFFFGFSYINFTFK
jgi:hypothetical protein